MHKYRDQPNRKRNRKKSNLQNQIENSICIIYPRYPRGSTELHILNQIESFIETLQVNTNLKI